MVQAWYLRGGPGESNTDTFIDVRLSEKKSFLLNQCLLALPQSSFLALVTSNNSCGVCSQCLEWSRSDAVFVTG